MFCAGLILLLLPIVFVSAMEMHGHAEDHSRHKSMLMHKAHYQKHVVHYDFDNIILTAASGERRPLNEILKPGTPVVLNYIFTTCTTICPVLSATFSQAQEGLTSMAIAPAMVSISIDPEQDTPSRLRECAKKFEAGQQWQFYTGKLSEIDGLMKDFDIYRGNKLNHIPVTFMKAADDKQWLRIDGFISRSDLLAEYKALVGL